MGLHSFEAIVNEAADYTCLAHRSITKQNELADGVCARSHGQHGMPRLPRKNRRSDKLDSLRMHALAASRRHDLRSTAVGSGSDAHRFDDQMSPCPRIVACRPSSCLQPRRDAQERNHGLPCDLDHAATLSDCESKQSTPHKHTTGSHNRRRARRHVREPTAHRRGSRPHHLVMPYPLVVPSTPHIGSPTRVKDRACTPPCQAVLWVASGATAACSWELNHLEQRRRACVDGQQVVQRDVAHSISI